MNVLHQGTLTLPLVSGTWQQWTRTTTPEQDETPLPLAAQAVQAAYNAYIIMDSYRPHSHAGHCFRTFHMFVDELCLQLISDYRTAVHRREARAQQSEILRLQGVGQHHPERAPVARELYFTLTAGQGTCLAASDGPRTTPSFATTRVGGGNG